MICRLALAGGLLLATGIGFVLIRNQHVIEGHAIRSLEDGITELNQEIEMWELRIAAVRDRQELSRRLRWVRSDLEEIESARVIELEIGSQVNPKDR
ncbi:MAG: hypothetical protein P1U85_01135 [Verrucomicrobiales bacterium]|nr:hypothetical protein [Verrucomicrobiales bacterium]